MSPVPAGKGLTREGPDLSEVKIIGVELACTPPGHREVELEMFTCSHTMMRMPVGYGYRQFRVTLHTSAGDVTLLGDTTW